MKNGITNILSGFTDSDQKPQLCLCQLNDKVTWACSKTLPACGIKKAPTKSVNHGRRGGQGLTVPWLTCSVAMLTCHMQSRDNAPNKSLSDLCFLIGSLQKTSLNKQLLNNQQGHTLTQDKTLTLPH